MTDREKMDKLNVSVSATLVERTHCICDMCHGTGKVISVLIPETKYRPKDKKLLLVNEPIRMWMCESCRDKLLRAISIPFQEPKMRSPMTDRERLTNIVCNAIQTDCVGHCNHKPCTTVEIVVDDLIANGVTVQEPEKRKTPTDLTGKCGSCAHARPTVAFGGSKCYISCVHPERRFRRSTANLKQRTCKACKKYKPMSEAAKED
jgi:hypothetical protein